MTLLNTDSGELPSFNGILYMSLFNSQDCCSVYTVRRLRKEWNILSTRKQKYSAETIHAEVSNIRKRYPLRGVEAIRKTLREEQGMRVPR